MKHDYLILIILFTLALAVSAKAQNQVILPASGINVVGSEDKNWQVYWFGYTSAILTPGSLIPGNWYKTLPSVSNYISSPIGYHSEDVQFRYDFTLEEGFDPLQVEIMMKIASSHPLQVYVNGTLLWELDSTPDTLNGYYAKGKTMFKAGNNSMLVILKNKTKTRALMALNFNGGSVITVPDRTSRRLREVGGRRNSIDR